MDREAPVYFDHHSTTPCDPRVVEAMIPYFSEEFGNASSITHLHGRAAAHAVAEARQAIATFLGAESAEVYFTSGATESNNIALRGLAFHRGRHLITSAIEHKSILDPAKQLEREGVEVTILPVDSSGFVDPHSLRDAIRGDTALVSIMAANAEIGSIEPIADLAAVCSERGVPFHTDATQAIGKIPFRFDEMAVDLVSLSAHKFYGPKGIGVLMVRRGLRVEPLVRGGGQEKGLRSGTINVPGVVGLAAALELRRSEMAGEAIRLAAIRDHLRDRLTTEIDGVTINGPRDRRLPGNLNASFAGLESEAVMMAVRRFSLSSGSACSSGDREPSSVLLAIGCDEATAMGSIRFGLGKSNTLEQIDALVEDLKVAVRNLREITI